MSTPVLSQQRCFNHAGREAVAKCPDCGSFFCRECVTEHDDRVICAACLKKLAKRSLLNRPGILRLVHAGQVLFGILVAWFFFHLVGQMLLLTPSSFHEGTVWEAPFLGGDDEGK